ncbi:hypothetical protein [Pedobacter nutrimenti]|uniref:hypothetical protein n=1 Tax=Pedobacter nutrimenti TaxID=1241337 RepID=UPI00292E32DD|nr:hypothetical protein [Pedobacter nutrimenti]
MNANDINNFKDCFKKISVKELNERISNYRTRVNLKTITEEHLNQELLNLFRVEINEKHLSFFLKSDTQTLPHNKYHFYRIRKFSDQDYQGLDSMCFASMQKEQDIWTRPSADVNTLGRLNQIKESVLYAAAQATNAIYETSCNEGEWFFLMIYENRKQMRLSQIHVNSYLPEFDELENAKHTILHNFLLEEFTKAVAPSQEYKYKSSIAIYKKFFYSPFIDAFTYPSIKTEMNLGFNICFSAEKAKENLMFCGLMVCKLGPPSLNSAFQIFPFYDGFLNENGAFEFYKFNSEISREKFGRFAIRRDMGL